MSGILEQANEKITIELCQDPEWARVLATYSAKMNEGFFNADYLDVFLQKWHRFRTYTLYDARAFAEMHTALACGKVLMASIHIDSEPHADAEVEENDSALSQIKTVEYHLYENGELIDATPAYFSASFSGGLADQDGWFAWDQPIHFSVLTGSGEVIGQTINAQVLPLEVGYTNAWISLGHLSRERGLARWPYDSKVITLLKVIDEDLWTVKFDMPDPPEPTSGLLKPRRELNRVIKPEPVTAQQLSLFG